MIATDIKVLIDKVKALPNSLERNKIVSHLEDAKAHAIALQYRLGDAPDIATHCTCLPGAVDTSCPVHG
jgi:hypothetical protein